VGWLDAEVVGILLARLNREFKGDPGGVSLSLSFSLRLRFSA